jgi:hypothetical protein
MANSIAAKRINGSTSSSTPLLKKRSYLAKEFTHSTRGVVCATHQLMRNTAAILFAVVLAMLITPLQLPASSCILSNARSQEGCKSKCCANMTCCAVSEKNTGPASQPLAQSGAAKQQVLALIATGPSSSLQPFAAAPIVCATVPVGAHSPPPLAASCIRLI